MNILGIVVSYVYIFCIILTAKLVEKKGVEASRKYIHIMLANWWFIFLFFFDNVFFASFVPATFVIINYISYKKDLIKVMERSEGEKDGLGTVYYAVSLLVLSIATYVFHLSPMVGLCGILIMGYGDGLAGVIGRKIKSKEYHIGGGKKTIAGSITMFCISLAISAVLFFIVGTPIWYGKAILLAALITIVEAAGVKGTDNLTVPLLAALLFGLMI